MPIRYTVLDDTYVTKIEDALGDTTGAIPFVPSTLNMMAFTYDALLKTDREKYKDVVLADIDKTHRAMLDAVQRRSGRRKRARRRSSPQAPLPRLEHARRVLLPHASVIPKPPFRCGGFLEKIAFSH